MVYLLEIDHNEACSRAKQLGLVGGDGRFQESQDLIGDRGCLAEVWIPVFVLELLEVVLEPQVLLFGEWDRLRVCHETPI